MDIRELAKEAGVSMATASRALNDRAEVSASTRQRVLEVAERLGYQPNVSARTLVRRRSDTVGLLWETIWITQGRSQPFLESLCVAVKMALDEVGLHLILLSTRDGSPDGITRQARAHSLDGLILMGIDVSNPAIQRLVEAGIPTVAFDLDLRGPRAASVGSDNVASAALAVDHLVGLGHTRIATIAGPERMLPAQDRLDGFVQRMRELHLDVPEEYIVRGDFFHDTGVKAMQGLLALPEPPTAVFAASDEMAIGAMRAVLDAGLRVPEDVSLVGLDDLESAALVRPSLTTLAQDHLALARSLVARLSAIVERGRAGEGDDAPSENPPTLLPTRLIVRESTGPAPV